MLRNKIRASITNFRLNLEEDVREAWGVGGASSVQGKTDDDDLQYM